MTRYIKQRDQFSCVPVVILNARKWLGHKVSYDRDYMNTRGKAGVIKGFGAYAKGFLRAARVLPMTRICKPNFAKVKAALDDNHAVIVRSRWKHGGHIFLVTRITERSVFCVNVYGGHVWRSRRLFKNYYLYPGMRTLAAWIIWNPSCLSSPEPKPLGSKNTSRPSSKSSQPRRRKARSCRST